MKEQSPKKISYLHEGYPGRLGLKMVSFTSIGRRDLVDRTGLIGGIYINTAREIERLGLECEGQDGCISPLISLESRIHMALDKDLDIYPMSEIIVKEADTARLITETNLRVVCCLKHKKARLLPLDINKNSKPGRLVELPGCRQILEGTSFRENSHLLQMLSKSARKKIERQIENVVDLELWKMAQNPQNTNRD